MRRAVFLALAILLPVVLAGGVLTMTDAPDWVPVETAVGATTASVNQVDADVLVVGGKVDAVAAQVVTLQGKVDTTSAQVVTLQGKVDATTAQVTTLQGKVDAVAADVNAQKGGWGSTTALLTKYVAVTPDGSVQTLVAAVVGKSIVPVHVRMWFDTTNVDTVRGDYRGALADLANHAPILGVLAVNAAHPTDDFDWIPGSTVLPVNDALAVQPTAVQDTTTRKVGFLVEYYLQ